MRKHFLDNLRWGTVLLVLVYHVFYLYNALGVPGGLGPFYETQPWDFFCTIVYPWFMALLFLIAGISARYALERQTTKDFLRSKNLKLLVPSTLGLLFYQAFVGWMNATVLGELDPAVVPLPIRYLIYCLSGIGPLWFIQMLWLFSLVLILLRKLPFLEKLCTAGERTPYWLLLLLVLPVWLLSYVGNTPIITTYRFGIYGTVYLLGYLVFSHEAVQERLQKYRFLSLALAAGLGVAYGIRFYGANFSESATLTHPLTNLYLWAVILALLGLGRAYLNRTAPLATYFTKSSFGIYIVHYLIVLVTCYLLQQSGLSALFCYLLGSIAVLVLSPLMYELLRRIPIIRFITFGIKKEKQR